MGLTSLSFFLHCVWRGDSAITSCIQLVFLLDLYGRKEGGEEGGEERGRREGGEEREERGAMYSISTKGSDFSAHTQSPMVMLSELSAS